MPTLFIEHQRLAEALGWHHNELRTIRRRLAGPQETRLPGSAKLYFDVRDAVDWLRGLIRVPPAVEARLIEHSVEHEII